MQYPPIIDLHAHSTASDGTYTPAEVAKLAKTIGLSAIALTDHDTIDGLAEFQKAGETLSIETIAGIEFAALWEKHHRPEIHIVGLGFDPSHPVLLERMKEIGASLGGEQSGHVIFLDENTTGDGLLSALHLLQVMVDTGKKLSELASIMSVMPQALVNAKVPSFPLKNTLT